MKTSFLVITVAAFLMMFATLSLGDELTQASKLLEQKNSEEAQKHITEYLRKNNDSKAYVQVGNIFARLKKWNEAVHYLEIAVNRNSKDALAWYELGIAQHQNKKTDDAVESLRKSITISSTTVKSVVALGEILELARDRFDAREIYSMAIKKAGDKPEFRAKLCWLNFQDSYFRETLTNCSKAQQMNPKDVVSATLLAMTLYNTDKHNEAFAAFQKIISKFPAEGLPYRARGLLYYQEKSYEQAAADLGKAFGLDAYDDEAAIHLARVLYELKHYAQAIPIYVESCRLNKTYKFEFVSRQRELSRKNQADLASQYQLAIDRI